MTSVISCDQSRVEQKLILYFCIHYLTSACVKSWTTKTRVIDGWRKALTAFVGENYSESLFRHISFLTVLF